MQNLFKGTKGSGERENLLEALFPQALKSLNKI